MIRRSVAANIIQRAWRRHASKKNLKRDILKEIREQRAKKLIGKWLRDMKFKHRLQLNKTHSFLKSITKEQDLYLQLDYYMKIPRPTNILCFSEDKI